MPAFGLNGELSFKCMGNLLQNLLPLGGLLLCLAVLIWLGFSLAEFSRSKGLLVNQFNQGNRLLEAKIDLLRQQVKQAENRNQSWEGFANFTIVRKVVHGDSNICSFYLKPKDERLKLAPFQPGQHLVFQLPVEGVSQPITRRYSLSDRPGTDYYRVSIKLHLPPRSNPEYPPGAGSSYFHNNLDEESSASYDSLIQVSSPAGAFSIDPYESKPLVLIGGGVGITPMLSMFNSVLEENPSREVWLIYTVRTEDESVLFDEGMLHRETGEIMSRRENVHIHVFCTKSESIEELSVPPIRGVVQHCARPSVEALKGLLPSNNYRFYICGPEAMMDQFESDLEIWGVPDEDILSERFQPPTTRKRSGDGSAEHNITFAKSGKELMFGGDNNTILETAESAGVPIAFDCRAGSCGQCKVAVVSGKVSYNIRTNYKCPAGSCLTCSCVPDGDVVLDC